MVYTNFVTKRDSEQVKAAGACTCLMQGATTLGLQFSLASASTSPLRTFQGQKMTRTFRFLKLPQPSDFQAGATLAGK